MAPTSINGADVRELRYVADALHRIANHLEAKDWEKARTSKTTLGRYLLEEEWLPDLVHWLSFGGPDEPDDIELLGLAREAKKKADAEAARERARLLAIEELCRSTPNWKDLGPAGRRALLVSKGLWK